MANIIRKVSNNPRKRKLNYGSKDNEHKRSPLKSTKHDAWNSCMDGFEGFSWKMQSPKLSAAEASLTQVRIEWTSDQEDESSDSPPLTNEDQLAIDVEESPIKQQQQQPLSNKFKTKTSHNQIRNSRTHQPNRNRNSWSPKIDFPDDITNIPQYPVKEKTGSEGTEKRKLSLLASGQINQSRSNQSQEIPISEYESEPEDSSHSSSEKNPCDESDNGSTSQPISSVDTPPLGTGTKATEWASNLQWTTPHKQQPEQEKPESAKKKHKFEKDSLADRMQKIMTRERVSYTMWKHKQNSAKKPDSGRCLSVEVQSYAHCFSHVITTCVACSESDLPASLQGSLQGQQPLRVLLLADLVPKLQAGDKIRIHPPWQKLVLPDGTVSILCSQHCQVVEKAAGHGKDRQGGWCCPCSTECSLLPIQCPYYANPCARDSHQADEELSMLPGDTTFSNLELSRVTQPPPPRTILPAIAEPGHNGVCFAAAIVRSFAKKSQAKSLSRPSQAVRWRGRSSGSESSSNTQHSILLQDATGTLCLLQIPNTEPWLVFQDPCEGQCFEFQGLRVAQRVAKSRNPALFSLLESVAASDKKTKVSENFCYILSASQEESSFSLLPQQREIPGETAEPLHTVQTLRRRCTVEARVYYVQDMENRDESQIPHIYLIDQSIVEGQGPVKVKLCPGLYLSALILEKLRAGERDVFTFRDLWCKNGEVYMDEFSQVHVSESLWEVGTIRPPHLSAHHADASVVTIEGTISDVDESTAFSWVACDKCKNDKLVGGTASNPFLFCRPCSKVVVNPVNCMHLEVFVLTKENPTTQVKLKLLQKTIESILPREIDNEGYEMSSVLQKSLGPLPCILTSSTKVGVEAQEIMPFY